MYLKTKILLAAICAVAVASVYAAQPILTEIGRDLGVAPDALGWLVSVGQLGYLVGLVVLVPLGDRLDRRRLIAFHLGLVGIGMIVVAAAPMAWAAYAGLAFSGLFAVVVQTTVAYAAAVSDPAERGRNLGFVTSGVVVGILGSRLIAGVLTDIWGWRSVYISLALLAMIREPWPSSPFRVMRAGPPVRTQSSSAVSVASSATLSSSVAARSRSSSSRRSEHCGAGWRFR